MTEGERDGHGGLWAVPVSRFKSEMPNVLTALEHQRRVLLSRHGNIVAAIEPPAEKHARLLLDFTTRTSLAREVPVLTMTDIGRGSPSASIRNAENGVQSLLTHRGIVRGVLTSRPEAEPLEVVDQRAAALSAFALTHPNATPEQFADFSDSLSAADDVTAVAQEPVASQWLALLSQLGTAPVRTPELVTSGYVTSVNFTEYRDRVIRKLEVSYDEVGLLTNAAQLLPDILHSVRPLETYTSRIGRPCCVRP